MPEIKVELKNNEDKESRFDRKEITTEEKDKALEKLYQSKEFSLIQKPPKVSPKTIIISIIVSFVIGILIGFFTAFFFKEKLSIFLKF